MRSKARLPWRWVLVGDAFGDRAIGFSRTGTSEIETILGHSAAAAECRFVHQGNQRHFPAERRLVAELCYQTTDRGHRLEFIAVHAASDKHVWAGDGAGELFKSERHGSFLPGTELEREQLRILHHKAQSHRLAGE